MSNGFGDGGGGFDFGGLFDSLLAGLVAAIEAIFSFLQALVQAIVNALNVLLSGEQALYDFGFQSLSEVWQGFKKLLGNIFNTVILASLKKLYDFYTKLQAWVQKLKAWLDKLHAIMQKYQVLVLRRVINIIQRARKILVLFRFLHFKWAQKLDNWLATIEGKIAHYLVLVAQKVNEVISWVNLIVDPRGALKTFPLLAGIIAALDVTWSGIFGTPFTWWAGIGASAQPTTHVSVTITQTATDVKNGAGDAGVIQSNWPTMQKQTVTEMGSK